MNDVVIFSAISITFLFLIVLTYFISNPIRLAKLMKKIFRKIFVVAFFFHGNDVFYKIIDATKESVNLGGKRYFFLNEYLRTLKEAVIGKKIDQDYIHYVDGVPCIFFDYDNAIPILPKSLEKLDPEKIQAILDKELAVLEAEALSLGKKKILRYIIITIIVSGIAAAITLIVYLNLSNIANLLKDISNEIYLIRSVLNTTA